MAFGARHSRALVLGASVLSLAAMSSSAAFAQAAEPETAARASEQKKKQAKRKSAEVRQEAQAQPAPAVMNARAQIGAAPVQSLDAITAVATKTDERAIDSLAPVSVVTLEDIQGRQASTTGGLLYNIPGVWTQDRGDEPSTSINIRGLQDFGRVAVVVDGARQNYQRTGHFANGSFFLNPELIGGIDIVRGPTANIYGSGAIGGVVYFRTKDAEDILKPGQKWAVESLGEYSSNKGWNTYLQGAVRVGEDKVSGGNLNMFGCRTANEDRNLAGVHLPPSDGLNRRTIAGEYGKIVLVEPGDVAHAAVGQRTDATTLLETQRDQLAEIAGAVAVPRPDGYLVGGDALAGCHFLGVAAHAVGRGLAADCIGKAGELAALSGKAAEIRRQSLMKQTYFVEHVRHVGGIDLQEARTNGGADGLGHVQFSCR